MATRMTDAEIVRTSQILSSNSEAIAQRDQIYGKLELPLADLPDLKRRVLIEGSESYGFFTQMLSKLRSMNGTINNLIGILRDLKLQCIIAQLSDPTNTSSKSVWFGVEFPVESFTGREHELSKLHGLLTRNTGTATVINQISTVSGLGGIGKTQLAKKYARVHYLYYQGNAIWIDSETEESFRNSLVKLLEQHFDISEQKSKDKTNTELLKIVYDQFSNRKCLIILDNVEEFDVIKLMPKSRNPTEQIPNILSTSRKSIWRTGIQVLSLDVLSTKEAVKFIHENIEYYKTDKDVLTLVNTLQCFPLALQQAVAYIKVELSENINPIQKYLQLFGTQNDSDLLNYKDEDLSEHEKTTFTTWNVTMEKIKAGKFGESAIQIMNIISCLGPEPIPTCLFGDLNSSNIGSSICLNQDNVVESTIALLKKYSMATGQPGVIRVHRLVQRVVRIKIDNDQIIESVLNEGLQLLEKYMNPESRNNDVVESLIPHAERIWILSMNYVELIGSYAHFPSDVCDKLNYFGRYGAMLHLAATSKPVIETTLGEMHVNSIRIKAQESEALIQIPKAAIKVLAAGGHPYPAILGDILAELGIIIENVSFTQNGVTVPFDAILK